MPTITVGYDASPAARAALELAVERATPTGKVIVVHAYHVPAEYVGAPYYQDMLDRALDAASVIMDDLEQIVPALAGVDWEPDVIEGSPAEALCRVARHRRADEIVIGTRGVGRFRGLLGSVAHDVLHQAHCPVLVMPQRAVEQRERHRTQSDPAAAAA